MYDLKCRFVWFGYCVGREKLHSVLEAADFAERPKRFLSK
jgi:hypothetical protein